MSRRSDSLLRSPETSHSRGAADRRLIASELYPKGADKVPSDRKVLEIRSDSRLLVTFMNNIW